MTQIDAQTQTLQHIELLGNIRNLDENLQTAVKVFPGISKALQNTIKVLPKRT